MELPTKDDIETCIKMMSSREFAMEVSKALEIAGRLKQLLPLYDAGLGGMAIVEVDIYLLGEEPGVAQRSQVHTFAVGDDYKVLPEDEDHDIAEWEVQDIRAHLVKKV